MLIRSFSGTRTISNDTVLDHSCSCQVVVYISQHGMAISFATISNFFADEMKLIERAENALKSNRLRGFTFDGSNGVRRELPTA